MHEIDLFERMLPFMLSLVALVLMLDILFEPPSDE